LRQYGPEAQLVAVDAADMMIMMTMMATFYFQNEQGDSDAVYKQLYLYSVYSVLLNLYSDRLQDG
jgi:hypothetical protein